jgi:hypothetical protein
MAKRIQKSVGKTRGRTKGNAQKGKSHTPRLIAFLISWLAAFLLLSVFKVSLFGFFLHSIAHRPTEGDYAGNLIRESISEYLAIVENKNNKDRLLTKLSDPVVWFNKKYTHVKFPGYSEYDRFEYVGPLQYDNRDPQKNNFEVRFDGVYRYRHPEKDLLNFESGTVIIEGGVISSLRTRKQPNAYTYEWMNSVYRNYWFACLLFGFLITLVFFNLSKIPEKIVERILNLGQRLIGA